MIKQLHLRVTPFTAHSDEALIEYIAADLRIPRNEISGLKRIRQSIDARSKNVMVQTQVEVFINEPPDRKFNLEEINLQNVSKADPVIVVGIGPAGFFAAFK